MRQRQRHPLVVLDASVVVGVQAARSRRPRTAGSASGPCAGESMCAPRMFMPCSERRPAKLHQHERLAPLGSRTPCRQAQAHAPGAHRLLKRPVPSAARPDSIALATHSRSVLFFGYEVDVFCSQFLQGLVVGLVVFVPCHVAFHRCPFLTVRGFPPQPSQAPNRGRFPRLPLFLRYYRRPVRQRPESRPIFHRAAKSTNTALADEL